MLHFERQCWGRDLIRLAGVDEAGRGPLAGPVFAAAVVLDRRYAEAEEHGLLAGLTDSKKISEERRNHFYGILTQCPAVDLGVGVAEVEEIDALNILNATHLAMARAVLHLRGLPDHALIDGLPVRGFPCGFTAIVGGDGKSLSIAAASVIAKVMRDRRMRELDLLHPGYGFAQHKGYGTSAHIQALLEHGPCEVHRRTFRPVMEAMDLRRRSGGVGPEASA